MAPSPRSSAKRIIWVIQRDLASHGPSDGFGDRFQLRHQVLEFFGSKALSAVGHGVFRIRMDLDYKAVRSRRNCRSADRRHVFSFSGSVAGINDDRKVAQGFEHRYRVDINGVPGVSLESSDSPFAEYYPGVVMAENVFGGVEEFFDGARQAAFQQETGLWDSPAACRSVKFCMFLAPI